MKTSKIGLGSFIPGLLLLLVIGPAHALPALQLGPGDVSGWTYNTVTETWETASNPFTLNAYANADAGGNGDYAWDPEGSTTQTAYLIAAATPDIGNVDAFTISIVGDEGALTQVYEGYGTPPEGDPNSVAPHGIYDTWYEVYEFQFNSCPDTTCPDTIFNTQPGDDGSGLGYTESFDITIIDLALGVFGVHFDLITLAGDGIWDNSIIDDNGLVKAFAPWSHDAAYVPVPAAVWLFGTALIGLFGLSRRKRLS